MKLTKLFRKKVLITILTRTSNRPLGFEKCRKSIENQTYKNIRHIVSYDNDKDLDYLSKYKKIEYLKVSPIVVEPKDNTKNGHFKFAPYNLYCNTLLEMVKKSWIIFLDDDDMLLHNEVIAEIVNEINSCKKNTLLIWRMRYPDGKLLPPEDQMDRKVIKMSKIGAPCVAFHSDYKKYAYWDCWKGSDFRIIISLFKKLKHKRWIYKPYIQINNFGDFGNKNDIEI